MKQAALMPPLLPPAEYFREEVGGGAHKDSLCSGFRGGSYTDECDCTTKNTFL
jgi:hypothetical protein